MPLNYENTPRVNNNGHVVFPTVVTCGGGKRFLFSFSWANFFSPIEKRNYMELDFGVSVQGNCGIGKDWLWIWISGLGAQYLTAAT